MRKSVETPNILNNEVLGLLGTEVNPVHVCSKYLIYLLI